MPRGRLGYELNADILLLHTIQNRTAFNQLLTTGVLRADRAHASSEWPDAYDWMYRMMAERLPTSGDAALWLWARIRRDALVANCRRARRGEEPQVLLTCRIPRERVLISQFDEWHAALNAALAIHPVPGETEAEFDARCDDLSDRFRARLDAAGVRLAPLRQWPAELRAEAERSWECIFMPETFDKRAIWQATVHEIRVDDVIDAVWIGS